MTFEHIDKTLKEYKEELFFFNKVLESNRKDSSYSEELDAMRILNYDKRDINFHCFVTASYMDLLCTYRNLKRSKTSWEKTYNLRIAYLTIYETINTYHKFKKEILDSIELKDIEMYNGIFKMLDEELLEFKHDFNYDIVISKIRNKTSAHYEKDFLEYYSNFDILENKTSKNIIKRFFRFTYPLHFFSFSLIKGEIDEFLFINSWMTDIDI